MPRALLFDLDGTLTDPYEGISKCFCYALEYLDVEPPAGFDFRQCIGPPMQQAFAMLFGADLVADAIALYRQRFAATGLYENALYPGIEDVLELAESSYSLFVCTSKPAVYANEILRHFQIDRYFTRVYGSELDGRFTYKPELLAHLLERERIVAADAVMIGDRKHDVVAALENGALAYGAAWGYGSHEELQGAGAHEIFESPQALGAALR